ncbi:MAG: helix-turn-helix transcriptional regulator, partial [Clostridia bacterium]|nr:helix-turn-helix transcriptional regulator [Clostridia bacterium]
MNTNTIGATIARLRRERQIKQEELANFVGVSVQAVSKWENGGMPDTDLLPKIADFFHVSIDTLFARDVIATGSLWNTIFEAVHSVPAEEEMDKV